MQVPGIEKKHNVIAELELIGLKLTTQLANLGVELAVQYLKTKAS